MRYRFFRVLLPLLYIVSVSGCNNDSSSLNPMTAIYPSILFTGEQGQELGGDGTDWNCGDNAFLEIGFQMLPAYPNPFQDVTNIEFDLLNDCHVVIYVYNEQWRFRTTVLDADRPAGHNSVLWNASEFPEGYYKCQMIVGDFDCWGNLLVLRLE